MGFGVVNASIDVNLKYGQSGMRVYELQEFLIDKGLLNSTPTGFFGLLTFKAVKNYQSKLSLPPTGFVGPLTRTEINKELNTVMEESIQAEIVETGTTTPVAVLPTPQVMYIPPPQQISEPKIEPIVVNSKPICNLVAERITNNAGDTVGKITWTSSNADAGFLNGTQSISDRVSSGSQSGFSIPQNFVIEFTGKGGRVTCEASL